MIELVRPLEPVRDDAPLVRARLARQLTREEAAQARRPPGRADRVAGGGPRLPVRERGRGPRRRCSCTRRRWASTTARRGSWPASRCRRSRSSRRTACGCSASSRSPRRRSPSRRSSACRAPAAVGAGGLPGGGGEAPARVEDPGRGSERRRRHQLDAPGREQDRRDGVHDRPRRPRRPLRLPGDRGLLRARRPRRGRPARAPARRRDPPAARRHRSAAPAGDRGPAARPACALEAHATVRPSASRAPEHDDRRHRRRRSHARAVEQHRRARRAEPGGRPAASTIAGASTFVDRDRLDDDRLRRLLRGSPSIPIR